MAEDDQDRKKELDAERAKETEQELDRVDEERDSDVMASEETQTMPTDQQQEEWEQGEEERPVRETTPSAPETAEKTGAGEGEPTTGASDQGAENTESAESAERSARVTDDDRGKPVVDGSGQRIGVVDEVRDGTAYVDPEQGLGGQLKSKLGWGADEASTYPLRNDAVDAVTDDEVRLRDRYA